jgi:hypothetical protein
MLPYLESRKSEIEAAIGHTLQWDPNPVSIDKTIVLSHRTNLSDPKSQEAALDWLVEYTIKFRETFSKLVAQQIES